MSSTIYLKTDNCNGNKFGDTTFSLHIPVMYPLYNLQVSSFFFRPYIKLWEANEEYIKYTYQISDIDGKTFSHTWYFPELYFLKEGMVSMITTLFKNFEFPYTVEKINYWGDGDIEKTTDEYTGHPTINAARTDDNRLKIFLGTFGNDEGPNLNTHLTAFEITEISTKAARLLGLKVGDKAVSQISDIISLAMTITGSNNYNYEYFQYINLVCNKVSNTATVISQTHFNYDMDESTIFYRPHVMGYLVNNVMSVNNTQTGLPIPSEYYINPADFNSIRFHLEYDNGDTVQLYAPMTIILTLIPVQMTRN